jgi:two-component system response regulator AtoC
LRFLQEKEFERVGGERSIKSNARVIAATNRDPWKMVKDGSFREDLYYRLSVASIKVPPLRERRSDIPLLIEYLLKKINKELHRNIKGVEKKATAKIMAYDWLGNVRELENTLTRAAIATHGDVVLDESISLLVDKKEIKEKNKSDLSEIPSLQDIEKEHILRVLQHARWHLGKTCEFLCVSRPTLRQKMKEYGISSTSESP